MPPKPTLCRACSVCLVSASWMPNTRPAAAPVSIARARPGRRRPAWTATNAMNAITAAAGQCENDPNDRPIGLADRETDSSATPVQSTTAPVISQSLQRRLGDRDGEDQREDQVGGEQRLDERQRQVPDRPRREYLPGDHAADAEQPAGLVEQVDDQPQRKEPRVGRTLRHVLLQHEASADKQRGEQGEPIVKAEVNVHGTLPDTPVDCSYAAHNDNDLGWRVGFLWRVSDREI